MGLTENLDGQPPLSSHNGRHLVVIVVSAIMLPLVIVFVCLNSFSETDLFISKVGAVSDKFRIEPTPADWNFTLWVVIFIAQLAFCGYALSTIFRKHDSLYLYLHPAAPPALVYGLYIMSSLLVIVWLIVWDQEKLEVALAMLILCAICLTLAPIISVRTLNKHNDGLRHREIGAIILLVHNALLLYQAWIIVATCTNLGIVLHYRAGVEMTTASTACLALLSGYGLLYMVLDQVVYEPYIRYVYTPYLVLAVAMGGILDNGNHGDMTTIMAGLLLGLSLLGISLKVIMSWYNTHSMPLYSGSKTQPVVTEAEDKVYAEDTKPVEKECFVATIVLD